MKKKVALLHTSLVFILREKMLFDLMEEILPDVKIINIVDDGMLQEVVENNCITPDVIKRMNSYIMAAESYGVDAIMNTCSSLGPATDVAKAITNIPVLRIDEGMAEKVSLEGSRIGIIATVRTTIKPTIEIIKLKAEKFNKSIEVHSALSEGAFTELMRGNIVAHDNSVVTKAKEISTWADCIVLAQSSMARLGQRIMDETGVKVYTTPRLGVEHLKRILS